MAESLTVRFLTDGPGAARTLIEEYVLDATDRLSNLDSCESFMFSPTPHPETGERSIVTFSLEGDADALLDHEQGRWKALVEDGPATAWKVTSVTGQAERQERLGERGAALKSRLDRLSVEMAKLAVEEFEDFGTVPGAVETYPGEERAHDVPLGWWVILHHITVQIDYSLEEELAAFANGIEHTLGNVAEFEGEEAVDERIDELVDALEEKREELGGGQTGS